VKDARSADNVSALVGRERASSGPPREREILQRVPRQIRRILSRSPRRPRRPRGFDGEIVPSFSASGGCPRPPRRATHAQRADDSSPRGVEAAFFSSALRAMIARRAAPAPKPNPKPERLGVAELARERKPTQSAIGGASDRAPRLAIASFTMPSTSASASAEAVACHEHLHGEPERLRLVETPLRLL